MKIAHIVSTFPPYQGGMGNTCYFQARELVKLGHEVTIFTPDYGRNKLKVQNQKFKVVYLKPLIKYGNAAFVPEMAKYLKKFEIIHFHYPFIGGAEMIYFKRIFSKKPPLILQYHMDLIFQGMFSFISKFYNLIFTSLILNQAQKITVSSDDYAENSHLIGKSFKINKEKFLEVPIGVDADYFKPKEKNKDLLKKYNLSENDRIILFVGGLDKSHYFKGITVLLQAVVNYKLQTTNYKLLIVGEGNLRPKYEKMAENLGIKDKVIFTGQVSNEELPDYYNLTDVFVLPSINRCEAFGTVLLEAMACKKPCLASNLPGVRTVVDNQKTGFLVEPNNPDDLAEKIKILLKDEDLRKKMSEQGRKKVEEKYHWPKIVMKLENLYENILKNQGR